MNEALKFAQSVTFDELQFISKADYGRDSGRHLEALKQVVFEQNCIVNHEQFWFPYEVVELVRWKCTEGHEREFAICNVIIALSVIAGADESNDPAYMLETIASEYDKLSDPLRELVVNVLAEADSKS